MKKTLCILLVFLLLLSMVACGKTNPSETLPTVESNSSQEATHTESNSVTEQPVITEIEEVVVVSPLKDITMENLTDAILSVSLEEGDAYVDDSGIMRMDLKIYTYDKYDMVDIANLKVGDTIVRHSGEAEVLLKEQNESGTIYINGGLEKGGFNLVTDDCGIFYEVGSNDIKNWYEVGEATIRVSADFRGSDNADPKQGEIILYPGDFLVGAVKNYDFTPYNTTIRVENGQIIQMNRVYVSGETNPSENIPIVESETDVEKLDMEEVYQNILTAINAGNDLIMFPEANPNIINELYEGLSDVELKQSVFYMHPITGFACEVMLVEVANENDLQTVIDIFEGRIALGTNETFYAETAALWKTNAQVQSFDNYVCMIALPNGYEIPENVFPE